MPKTFSFYMQGREVAADIDLSDTLDDDAFAALAARVAAGEALDLVAKSQVDQFFASPELREVPWTKANKAAVKEAGVTSTAAWHEFRRGFLECITLAIADEIDESLDTLDEDGNVAPNDGAEKEDDDDDDDSDDEEDDEDEEEDEEEDD